MSDATHDRILELLLLSRDPEQLTEAQRSELNSLLRASEANQVLANQFLMDGESLTELLKTSEIAGISAGRAPRRKANEPHRPIWRRLGFVALLAALATIGLNHFTNRTPVAQIEDRIDARFEQTLPPNSQLATHRPYRLLEGMATIRFRNGVIATLKAPAELEILDPFTVNLASGRIRAVVPMSGQGFTVRTPAADVEDLGTEFAVAVDAASGESEVHVFDGLVHINSLSGGKLLKALESGGSIRLDRQERQQHATQTRDSFPAASDVRYLRWKQASDALRQDPDLICYYTFESKAPVLSDMATQGKAIDGSITGAEWVSGRWPEKRALLFDDVGDRVQIDISQKLQAMGLSAWVYQTGHHSGVAPILNTETWEAGDIHLQLNNSQRGFFVGIGQGIARDRHAAPIVKTGRWMHLAVSIDTTTRKCITWVDGTIASQSTLKPNTLLNLDTCFLGDWVDTRPEEIRADRRSFKGRMDEIAIWRRALTEAEVKGFYRAGSPSGE